MNSLDCNCNQNYSIQHI